MSGIDEPGTPPEVPEEYAAVYRDAYQRALEEEGDLADELLTSSVVTREPAERPSWAVPAAVGAGALVLVLCAFVLGRMLSSGDADDTASEPTATASRIPASSEPSPTPSKKPSPKPTKTAKPGAWEGEVSPVAINAVTATCTSRPGTDSAGKTVRYDAGNAVDGDPTTAWRCDGTAVGTVLTLTLPAGTDVGEVGLIPGYAKTDPKSGADRYAENNRITQVRWTLADGTAVVQRLDADPDFRDLQVLRVPRTTTGTITMEILAVERGRRNTTAISEFGVSQAR
jgi:hypothetical protein